MRAGDFFCQARKFFLAEISKMIKCHFWGNVMLRQPHDRASRAYLTQKLQALKVVLIQKLFKAYIFLFFGELVWSIYFWVICP